MAPPTAIEDVQRIADLVEILGQHARRAGARGAASLAFPGIGTGAYGYPDELAAGVAEQAVRAMIGNYRAIRAVIFCCLSEADLAVYASLINEK